MMAPSRVPRTGCYAGESPSEPRPLTGARAPERQSASAGGPRGRADRAKSTSRRTYGARNFVVSEFSPAAQIAGNERVLPLGCGNEPAAAGSSGAQLGPMRECLKGGTRRAPHRAPQAEPGADCPFALAVVARQCDPRLVRFCCVRGGLESRHAAPAPTAETRFPLRSCCDPPLSPKESVSARKRFSQPRDTGL
jgi:hypothetical protein